MTKNLVIVESPTKTKTISKILGKDYKVMASIGHLRDLPKSQFGVDIENNFEPKYINVRGKAKIINELKAAAKKADKVYLATDPDREGEAISWHLAHLLDLDPEEANRVSFTEITEYGVKEGMGKPRKIDLSLVDSQQARRIMDRIVGYEISPILWKKVKSGLSAGRVQSVAVKLIVDREREIEAFVPEEYWSIHGLHKKGDLDFSSDLYGRMKGDKAEKLAIGNKEEADMILADLADRMTVTEVKQSRRSRKPYAPFTTSTLQQEASRRLGFSTSKTMTLAQQLYEGIEIGKEGQVGLITYMRTDSTRLSQQFIGEAKAYILEEFGDKYASKGIAYAGKKSNAQDAHEGIRPSSAFRDPQSMSAYLSRDQFRLYDLIWRRAVASQMKSAVYKSTLVKLDNQGYEFRVNGVEPVFDGFQRVWPTKDSSVILPPLKKGEEVSVLKFDQKQHFTQPPSRYTEASLVQVLEENGIGRPSTYAATIKSIQSRRYVDMEEKKFFPTQLGKNVNDFLVKSFSDIINEKFTAEMEERLDAIADGKVDWRDLMSRFYGIFSKDLTKAKQDMTSYKVADKKTGEKCPECGSDLVIKHGRNGDFIGCSSFPDCTYTASIIKKVGVSCPRDGGDIIEKISKRGKVFYACSNYPACDYASWDKPTGENCPLCGDLMVHRKNRREDRIYCNNEDCPNHKK